MDDYALRHLSDAVLLRSLSALVDHERRNTAMLLAHIAEVDSRQLYRQSGCPSMHVYCVDVLHLSDDAAYKRIQAARAARQFPTLFRGIAEGRLHLAAICLLAPHLTPENVDELVDAATHRRKAEIESWLARRFEVVRDAAPVRPLIRAIPNLSRNVEPPDSGQLPLTAVDVPLTPVDGGGGGYLVASVGGGESEHRGGDDPDELAPGQVDGCPERYLIRLAISKGTHDKLRRAQALLSHAVPSGDVAQVLDRALDALIAEVEKRRFGRAPKKTPHPHRPTPQEGRRPKAAVENSAQPRHSKRARVAPRHIPAPIRRAVWERDNAQCTFVAANGARCEARHFLEFDHVRPVARGGKASVEGLRLRCQAHNQYEAERVFGADFMKRKREKARLAATEKRERAGENWAGG